MSFRILSLDGGGIRGLITTSLLERLEASQPGFVKQANMIAGTSTGGIIALGLAFGMTPSDLTSLYLNHGAEIFDDSWMHDLADLGGLSGAKYDNAKLRALLVKTFGTATLGDLESSVVIPTFNLSTGETPNRWGPRFMHNLNTDDSDKSVRVVDAALRTSAAPTYFPSTSSYIDGGVAANDPSMCAVARALESEPVILKEIVLLSLGTGDLRKYVSGEDHDWGDVAWLKAGLIDLLLDANLGIADYQCSQILGKNYCRVNPSLGPSPIPLDAWKRSADLVKIGQGADLAAATAWLKSNWTA